MGGLNLQPGEELLDRERLRELPVQAGQRRVVEELRLEVGGVEVAFAEGGGGVGDEVRLEAQVCRPCGWWSRRSGRWSAP